MEEKILPVQPVRRIKKVRPARPVRLKNRLRYRSKLKKNLPILPDDIAEPQKHNEAFADDHNKAHENPEHIGDHIDYKA